MELRLTRFHRVGAAAHAVALSGDGEHLLVGSEHGLRLLDRRGNARFRLGRVGRAFNAVALSPDLSAGLAMERAGRLFQLKFEPLEEDAPAATLRVAAVGIWEQQDDLYSLDYAPTAGEDGLIALGHHALGLTALDGRGQLLWRLGPREGLDGPPDGEGAGRRTWHATISPDGRAIYAAALGGAGRGSQSVQRSAEPSAKIVAIDALVGKPARSVEVTGRVTLLASLPAPLGVAAALRDGHARSPRCQLVAFDEGLRAVAWSRPCPPGVLITAVASAPAQAALIIGTNTGELWRIGSFTGRLLAQHDLLFGSTVLSVAVAESGAIAAGLANGQVAFLEPVNGAREV